MSEKMREEFQSWVVNFHRGASLDGEIHSDTRYPSLNGQWIYDDWDIQSSWATWQASRAALCVDLPYDVKGGLYRLAMEDCEDAIKRAGIRVKK